MRANSNQTLMKSKLKITLLFCFMLTAPVTAQITIDDETIHVETAAYTVEFNRGVITHIHNKHTDEIYTLRSGASWKRAWSGLLNHRHFWNNANISTRAATLISAEKIDNLHAELVYHQGGTDIRLFIAVDPMTDDLLIDIEGESDTPGVVGMQWGIRFLDLANSSLIAPVDGGRIIDATTPVTYVGYPYPSSGQGWEAQLAIVQGEHGGFFVRNTDATFQFKQLIYDRDDAAFNLNFTTFNQAPFDTHTTARSVLWRFNTYTGDWRVPARVYRDWMDKAFQPRRLSDMPAWVEDIGLFVGSPKSNVGLKNIAFLDKLAEQVDPTKTLLMAKEWSNPQDWSINPANHHPAYEPMPELRNFLEVAKRHGFRVILYTDMHAFSVENPLYPQFMQYQYRDPWTGELLGWWWNTTSTHRYASINPASSAFRELFINELKPV